MSTLRERVIEAGREAVRPFSSGAPDVAALAGARAALEQAQQRYAVIGPYRDMNQIVSDLLADLSPSPAVASLCRESYPIGPNEGVMCQLPSGHSGRHEADHHGDLFWWDVSGKGLTYRKAPRAS